MPDFTDKRLRIGVLTGRTPYPHGLAATRRIHLMARALSEATATVNVWVDGLDAWTSPRNHRAQGENEGISFEYLLAKTQASPHRLRRIWDRLALAWAAQARLAAAARSRGLDGLYFYTSVLTPDFERFFVRCQARRWHFPVVIDLCEAPWSLKPKPTRLEKRVSPLWGASGVICISRFLEDWVRQENDRLGWSVRSLYVPILVDVNESQPTDYRADRKTVLFAGSPAYDATLRCLVAAMRGVWARHADCQLVITGGASRATVGGLTNITEDQICFAGYLERRHLLRAYADATVLTIPMFDDVRSIARFPTKLGEYLASGRPVVTSRVGEIPRFLQDGVNACLAPPGDAEALGAAIVRLLDQPAWACKIGQAGRRVAEECFHYGLHGARLCNFFASGRSFGKA